MFILTANTDLTLPSSIVLTLVSIRIVSRMFVCLCAQRRKNCYKRTRYMIGGESWKVRKVCVTFIGKADRLGRYIPIPYPISYLAGSLVL